MRRSFLMGIMVGAMIGFLINGHIDRKRSADFNDARSVGYIGGATGWQDEVWASTPSGAIRQSSTPAPPAPAKYVIENCPDPTALTKGCSQSLRMKSVSDELAIAQRDYSMALQELQKANAAVDAQAAAIAKENGWPDTVQFNRQTGQFADTKRPDPPTKPEPPEAKP